MISRILREQITEKFFKGKAIILTGARQTGKTTLIMDIINNKYSDKYIYLNGDEHDIREMLSKSNSNQLERIIGEKSVIFIDEAQRINNIGLTSKIIIDNMKDKQLILSGSSALDMAATMKEPLTGRKYEFTLYPLTFSEMSDYNGLIEEKRNMETRILYGFYPEIVSKPDENEELLKLLTESYLYKDIFSMSNIRKPHVFTRLVKALALQIGNQISFNELSNIAGIDKQTVEKYLDLLERAYVIFTLNSYSRNIRNELKKSKKIYFWDTGIRNAIINNFNGLSNRMDKGHLWENFIIAERIKKNIYRKSGKESYFWRTTQKQEIDYVEQDNNELLAVEIKWRKSKKNKIPSTFIKNYDVTKTLTIDTDNYVDFVL